MRTFYLLPGQKLPFDVLYQALGRSPEVYRSLRTLRNEWGIPIPCEMVPKANRRGKYGTFYIGAEVTVWEPRDDAEGGEA